MQSSGPHAALRPLLSAIAVLALSGCAAKVTTSSEWLNDDRRSSPYTGVLVVALTEVDTNRLSFEEELARNLVSDNVQVWPSSAVMDAGQTVNAASITPVAAELGADAVVVSRVSAFEARTVDTKPYTDVTARRKEGSVFRYDYVEKDIPALVTPDYTAELTTDVVDVATGTTVYTVVSSTEGQESLGDIISVLSDSIAARLRRDGVIR